MGLVLPEEAEEKLLAYLALLTKWNRTYNLTAIRNEADGLTHHLLDSLAVMPFLEGTRSLADVGSGAGLPGLPIAMARPDVWVTSIESNQKKAAFQRQVKIELGLSNVSVHCGRVESMKGSFDGVISRAFASLADFVHDAGHLSDCLFAMKGTWPAEELEKLPVGWRCSEGSALTIPGLDAQRHLLILKKS
ncbi:MAG: 16S rRNA (guanine(527)-N(7))-methyltransferase RsmG [Rhodocyclaceae bacterium]|nr:16S rRNA (guanine(527)-N(7))-methyltransferase RsmG [Rhodocyclaceae bacterium]